MPRRVYGLARMMYYPSKEAVAHARREDPEMTPALPEMMIFSHLCNPQVVTGAEKALLRLALELRRFFRCTLVVPQDGVIAAQARAAGMETVVLNIPLSVGMYLSSPRVREEIGHLQRRPEWRHLLGLLRRRRPAWVLANTCVHPLPALAAKRLGIPVIWCLNETMAETPHRHLATGIIAAHADRIVALSPSTLAAFTPEALVGRAAVLPPCIDRSELNPAMWPAARAELRSRLGWDEGVRAVGYLAATIYGNKGLRELVQAFLFVAARNPAARLLVAGSPADPVYYEACRKMATNAGIGDRIAWLPYSERIDLIVPAVDVVAVPSLIPEGFGMTALEGLCFEKPVVAFASGGLMDILTATGNAEFLVPVGDAATLAVKLEALLADDARRIEIGRQGAAMAEAVFGPAAYRARLEAFVAGLPAVPPASPETAATAGRTRRRRRIRKRRGRMRSRGNRKWRGGPRGRRGARRRAAGRRSGRRGGKRSASRGRRRGRPIRSGVRRAPGRRGRTRKDRARR